MNEKDLLDYLKRRTSESEKDAAHARAQERNRAEWRTPRILPRPRTGLPTDLPADVPPDSKKGA